MMSLLTTWLLKAEIVFSNCASQPVSNVWNKSTQFTQERQ